MKTSIYFQKWIRQNKKKLLEGGVPNATFRAWAYGYRMPSLDGAARIASILNVPIKQIPYRQVLINQP